MKAGRSGYLADSSAVDIWNTAGTWAGAAANLMVVAFTAHVLKRDARERKRQRAELSDLAREAAVKGIAAIRNAHVQLAGIHPDKVDQVAPDRLGALQRAQDVIANVLEREFDYNDLERLIAISTLIDEAKELVRPLNRYNMIILAFDQDYASRLKTLATIAERV